MLEFLIGVAASTAVAVFSYSRSRRFVSERLRYVDAIQHPAAPLVAAAGALVIAAPVVAMLPVLGGGTALAFGISVGLGVASGRGEVRRSLPPAL